MPGGPSGRLGEGQRMEDGRVGQGWRFPVEPLGKDRGKAEHSSPSHSALYFCQCRGPGERPRACPPSLPTSTCAYNELPLSSPCPFTSPRLPCCLASCQFREQRSESPLLREPGVGVRGSGHGCQHWVAPLWSTLLANCHP